MYSSTLQLKCAAKVLNELAFFIPSFEGLQRLYAFHNETWIVLFLPLDSVLPSFQAGQKVEGLWSPSPALKEAGQ